MFIIIVFRLDSDVSCFFCFISTNDQLRDVTHRMGRVVDFSFSSVQVQFVFY